jgi:hypothetical protein
MWEDLVIVHELKGCETIQEDHCTHKAGAMHCYEPFLLTSFNERLISLVAADDQVRSLS